MQQSNWTSLKAINLVMMSEELDFFLLCPFSTTYYLYFTPLIRFYPKFYAKIELEVEMKLGWKIMYQIQQARERTNEGNEQIYELFDNLLTYGNILSLKFCENTTNTFLPWKLLISLLHLCMKNLCSEAWWLSLLRIFTIHTLTYLL